MTSTNRTTIAARAARGIAAGALMAGIAVGTAGTAGAERVWDIWKYDFCMLSAPDIEDNPVAYYDYKSYCCTYSGGDWDNTAQECYAPAPAENVPQPPGQSTPPPVLQNPPQTSIPLIPTPRGPNSGTIG
jgi:hypothetical protein